VVEAATSQKAPILLVQTGRGQQVRKAKFKIDKLVDIMGWKAVGAKLMDFNKTVTMEWEQPAVPESNGAPELFE